MRELDRADFLRCDGCGATVFHQLSAADEDPALARVRWGLLPRPEPALPVPAARRYMVPLGCGRRAVVTVCAEEDVSLPVPMEREDWRPVDATAWDAAHAFAALHHAPVLGVHEIAFKTGGGL